MLTKRKERESRQRPPPHQSPTRTWAACQSAQRTQTSKARAWQLMFPNTNQTTITLAELKAPPPRSSEARCQTRCAEEWWTNEDMLQTHGWTLKQFLEAEEVPPDQRVGPAAILNNWNTIRDAMPSTEHCTTYSYTTNVPPGAHELDGEEMRGEERRGERM